MSGDVWIFKDAKVMTELSSKAGPSAATLRALKRVAAGEQPTTAAKAEGINPSTLFRALAKRRPPKLYLIVDKRPEGIDAWIEDQNYRQRVPDVTFATVADLQAALPGLLAKC